MKVGKRHKQNENTQLKEEEKQTDKSPGWDPDDAVNS